MAFLRYARTLSKYADYQTWLDKDKPDSVEEFWDKATRAEFLMALLADNMLEDGWPNPYELFGVLHAMGLRWALSAKTRLLPNIAEKLQDHAYSELTKEEVERVSEATKVHLDSDDGHWLYCGFWLTLGDYSTALFQGDIPTARDNVYEAAYVLTRLGFAEPTAAMEIMREKFTPGEL